MSKEPHSIPSEDLREFLQQAAGPTLTVGLQSWLAGAQAEIQAGGTSERFADLQAEVARRTRDLPFELAPQDLARANTLVPGWWPEHWSLRDLARTLLTLSLPDLAGSGGRAVFEAWLDTADEGELVAGMRCLCLLPEPERFLARAEEGCRSNMKTVFEATVCDTPYPAAYFGEIAWKQALLKSLFIGAPTWRIHGIDDRLSPDLARMALDYLDERRSAGREVPLALWLLLGPHGGERGRRALEWAVQSQRPGERLAAVFAFTRAGDLPGLAAAISGEVDQGLRQTMVSSTHGPVPSGAFAMAAEVERDLSNT